MKHNCYGRCQNIKAKQLSLSYKKYYQLKICHDTCKYKVLSYRDNIKLH